VLPSQPDELVDGFRELAKATTPDGLMRSELAHGEGDQWRIMTLWRDRAALDAMRASGEPPAAPMLFRSVDAELKLTILTVSAGFAVAHD
jgi:hypothetical protein